MNAAARLIEQADALLLDFDGPIAALMPPPVNRQAADRARAALAHVELPPEVASSTDHLAVLRWTLDHRPADGNAVEAACTAAEVDAARTCQPSVHAIGLLDGAARRGQPVAIVSNNAEAAVRAFVNQHGWSDKITCYACRTPETARQLKPDTALLRLAAESLGIDLVRSVFVGDSVTDAVAGNAAGVPVIALAKHDQRRAELARVGVTVIAGLMDPEAFTTS